MREWRDRPLVTRPSDPRQASHADRLLKDSRRRYAEALRTVLATPEGRRVLWQLAVEDTGLYASLSHAPDLAYVAGRHDVGVEWRDQAQQIDPDGWALMEHEALARRTQTQAAIRDFEASEQARRTQEGLPDAD